MYRTCGTVRQDTDDIIQRMLSACRITKDIEHEVRTSNSYCFSTETEVTRTQLSIILYIAIYPGQLSWYTDWLRAGRYGDRIPVGGEIFFSCPDRPWSPPSLLYNGYWVFPEGKKRPGRGAVPSPPSSAADKKE